MSDKPAEALDHTWIPALRQQRVCADCGGDEFVEDHAAGDIVCKRCGLVAEAHIIDERSEWRTFGDKEKEGDDPSRVGAAANPFNESLSTGIGKMQGANNAQFNQLTRLQNRQSAGDRAVSTAMREISSTCEKLRLVDAVKNSAYEVFKDVHDAKALKGRPQAAVYAACIYVAAKRERNPRTFKEICAVMPDVSKVEIGRCFTAIDRMYKNKLQYKAMQQGKDLTGAVGLEVHHRVAAGAATQASDIIKRFMSKLGADQKLTLLGQRVAVKASELAAFEAVPWASRDPATQALALIYGVMHLHKIKNPDAPDEVPDFETLSKVGGMAASTTRDCFKQMLPYMVKPDKLIPVNDGPPQILARLETVVAEAMGPGGQDKYRKKSAAGAATPNRL